MGLIKAGMGSLTGVLADQWKEFFYCDAIPDDILVLKAKKHVNGRSSNTKGTDNVITEGSVFNVAPGQAALVVDNGQVTEVCMELGQFRYDSKLEPTVFNGSVEESVMSVFERFSFGGIAPKDQRLYYVNTKEIISNKYGTATPIPFRNVDDNAGIDIDIAVRCFGEYSYRITNPVVFFQNVCGNVTEPFTRSRIDAQLKTELLTALQPTFAKIGENRVRYSSLPMYTMEMAKLLNAILSEQWKEKRGIEIVSFGISSITASEQDAQMLKDLQKTAVFRDPGMAAATLTNAQADAMKAAASNTGTGAMMAFMGMNAASNMGGIDSSQLFAMHQQNEGQKAMLKAQQEKERLAKEAEQKAKDTWKCSCGAENTGNFCMECGAKKPEQPKSWKCSCGGESTGNFCPQCGAKKPVTVSYKCNQCGWTPEDPTKPPKFCPECGDPFNTEDAQ